jgi:hypothetical protein
MNKRILSSEKGLTLVELLGYLAIISVVSVMIIGYLISSINNFKKVNEEIALHDEANYVMSEFVNYIFVATKVVPFNPTNPVGSHSLVKVTDYEGKETVLGFQNKKAVIINKNRDTEEFTDVTELSTYTFQSRSSDESVIKLEDAVKNPDQDTIEINMFLQNELSEYKKEIELNSKVSFVKVD